MIEDNIFFSANHDHIKKIRHFLDRKSLHHRHLDWGELEDWIDLGGFYILCDANENVKGLISIPIDPDGNTWVRLFAVDKTLDIYLTSGLLLRYANDILALNLTGKSIFSIALWDWYKNVLCENCFRHSQTIVTLEQNLSNKSAAQIAPIQPALYPECLQILDIAQIARLDHLAFQPPWQLNTKEITNAFNKSNYATCYWHDDQIIAYQLSSSSDFHAHINRIAVTPSHQGQGYGSLLIQDILTYYTGQHIWSISVNTQADNAASIALYNRFGFKDTQDNFAVYEKIIR